MVAGAESLDVFREYLLSRGHPTTIAHGVCKVQDRRQVLEGHTSQGAAVLPELDGRISHPEPFASAEECQRYSRADSEELGDILGNEARFLPTLLFPLQR